VLRSISQDQVIFAKYDPKSRYFIYFLFFFFFINIVNAIVKQCWQQHEAPGGRGGEG